MTDEQKFQVNQRVRITPQFQYGERFGIVKAYDKDPDPFYYIQLEQEVSFGWWGADDIEAAEALPPDPRGAENAKLLSEVERLQAALRPFADLWEAWEAMLVDWDENANGLPDFIEDVATDDGPDVPREKDYEAAYKALHTEPSGE